jgi:hypothetical protein
VEDILKYFQSKDFEIWLELTKNSPGPNIRKCSILEYSEVERMLYEKKKKEGGLPNIKGHPMPGHLTCQVT